MIFSALSSAHTSAGMGIAMLERWRERTRMFRAWDDGGDQGVGYGELQGNGPGVYVVALADGFDLVALGV